MRLRLLSPLLVATLAVGLGACSGGGGTAARKPTPPTSVHRVDCVTGYVAAKDGSGQCVPSPLNLPAVWTIDPSAPPTKNSSSFVALVSVVQCNDGRPGTPVAPQVKADGSTITVTFEVLPINTDLPSTCPAGPGAPYTVELDGPVGNRQLVDGICSSGAYAGTAWCNVPAGGNGGVRWPVSTPG
jgi:hypothetical protein